MAVDINDTPNRVRYTATAGQTVFSVPFQFLAATDLKLYQNSVLKTLSTHYTVVGAGASSGTVTLVSGAALSDDVLIIRDLPVERIGDFPISGPFDVESLNRQLDAQTMMVRDMETRIERRLLRQPVSDLPETLSDMPTKINRAGKFLYFDESGQPSALATTPVMDQLLIDAEAAADAANVSQGAAASSAFAAAVSASEALASAASAEASKSTSVASAGSSQTSATSSASSAAAAMTAKNNAEAAAEASGSVQFYDTKSLANAALAGLTADQVVEIFADESRSNRRTRYRKESGSYVFKLYLDTGRTVYLDSKNGLDANSGLVPEAPVKTWTTAYDLLRQGDTLAVHGGSRFFGSFNLAKKFVTVTRYGYDAKPIFDGSRKIPAASWVQHPTYANVWYVDVTSEQAFDSPNNGFCIWQERSTGMPVTLAPKFTLASIALNASYVNDNIGFFTCHRQGSTVANPYTDSYSNQYRYYVRPPAGTDPSVGTVEYYYAEPKQVFNPTDGCVLRDIVIQRTAAKDMSGHNQNLTSLIENCEFLECYTHSWVGGAIGIRGSYACSRKPAGDYINRGGGGFHLYQGNNNYTSFIENCTSEYHGLNYYSHSGGVGIPEHEYVKCRDLVSRYSGAYAFSVGENTTRGIHVDGFQGYEETGGFHLPIASTVRNFRLHILNPVNSCFRITGTNGGEVYAENGTIVVDGTPTGGNGPGALASNGTSDGANYVTLRLNRVTTNAPWPASVLQKNVDLIADECILSNGVPSGYSTTQPFRSIVARNTQLAWFQRSLEDIQAVYAGVENSCVCPWVRTQYTKTIASGDLLNVAASVSAFNDGDLAQVRFNTTGGLVPGCYIRIVDAYGTGVHHDCWIVSQASGLTYNITPSFSSWTWGTGTRNVEASIFNRKVFSADLTSITATFSDDGTQALFNNLDYVSAGTWVFFGGVGRKAPFGPRKIVSMSGSTGTLDRAVNWKSLVSTDLTYGTLASSNGNPRPSVSVTFGFPLRPAQAGVSLGPTIVVDTSASGVADRSLAEALGTGGVGRFNVNQINNSYRDSAGNVVSGGQINHERGQINVGLSAGVGDIVTFAATAYIEDLMPQFASDPSLTARMDLINNGYLAQLRWGARYL